MPNMYIPPFHFLNEGLFGSVVIYSATGVTDAYGEEFGGDLSWIKPHTRLGAVQCINGEWIVYFPTGTKMGVAPSKWLAAEGLLRLYIAQNMVQRQVSQAA